VEDAETVVPAAKSTRKKKTQMSATPGETAPRRKTSLVEQQIKADLAEGEKGTIRYSVVRCDLRHALRNTYRKRALHQVLYAQATDQGIYRKIVGMAGTSTILQCIRNGHEVPTLNKTFFDRLWSAIDHAVQSAKGTVFSGKEKSNALTGYVRTFLEAAKLDPAQLPSPVGFELRQPTTKEMETVALNHVTVNLERRVGQYVLWRLANLPSLTGVNNRVLRSLTRKLTSRALRGVTTFEADVQLPHPQVLLRLVVSSGLWYLHQLVSHER
jgi:hypothetical protein